VKVTFYQLSSQLILELCLGENETLAINVDVVAVRAFEKTADLAHDGRELHLSVVTSGVQHCLPKIDVLSLIAWGIDIRHVGGDCLLSVAGQLEKALEVCGE